MRYCIAGLMAFAAALSGCTETMYTGNEPLNAAGTGGAHGTTHPGGFGGSTAASTAVPTEDAFMADCAAEATDRPSPFLSRACSFDASSKKYPHGASNIVLPNLLPFGSAVQFAPGWVPNASDVTTEGPDAALVAFVSPDAIADIAFPSSKTLDVQAQLSSYGALIITVLDPVPSDFYVTMDVNFGALYRSRVAPPNGGSCDLPDASYCDQDATLVYRFHFLVTALPNEPNPPTPAGSCLLLYNRAMVPDPDEACCYRLGEANHCDKAITCSASAGAGCCLIYGTGETQYGNRCCLYANGELGDGAEECSRLLSE